jgi:SNF2 family DNA or RNA helicase
VAELRLWRQALGKTLVIAPKRVATTTWPEEAIAWDHLRGLRVSVITGTAAEREAALKAPADVYAIARDNVDWLVQYWRHDWPYDAVVLDEATSFKNPQAKRFKALRRVIGRCRRVVELTGTPAAEGLMGLWAQMYLLDAGQRLGRTLGEYRDRYFSPGRRNGYVVYDWRLRPGAKEAILAAVQDVTVVMRAEDWLDLPPITYDDIRFDLNPEAAAAYKRLEKELCLAEDITAGTAGALTGKLAQLCGGALYTDEGDVTPVHNDKIEALTDTLEGLGEESALVYYGYRHEIPRILEAASALGLRAAEHTGAAERLWNAGELDLLLAHPAACAYGLNLQRGGHHIIWYTLTWSRELYEQANKRLHRPGQDDRVIVHHLLARGRKDEDILRAQRAKGEVSEALLAALLTRRREILRED